MASTTFFLPLKSLSLYVFPSVARSVKSGAGSPTFKVVFGGVVCWPSATTLTMRSSTRHVNNLFYMISLPFRQGYFAIGNLCTKLRRVKLMWPFLLIRNVQVSDVYCSELL